MRPHRVMKVEESHRVRAIVCAVSGAHASVIDLSVQSFLGMVRGIDGADRLTRSVLAMLAQHRHEAGPHVRILAFEISLDADPVDRTTERRFVRSDGGNVILRAACYYARFAPRAAVEVNHHRPLRFSVALVSGGFCHLSHSLSSIDSRASDPS